jgi:hypothetical protein
VTPDREPADAVLERNAVTEAAALVAGAVPAPRPEVLARVLDGLRDLPAARRAPREPVDAGADDPGLPLPRRRS